MPLKRGVAIIGLGNWGTSLAHACLQARIPLIEVIVRTRRRNSHLPQVNIDAASLDAQVLWLCVRDAEIAEVTQQIAARRKRLDGQIVVHSSGALTAKALDAAKRAGAHVASVAPVMSFPTRAPVSLKDLLFAVEAEPAARRTLQTFVRKLGGRPFSVASGKKPLYHAAATLASPLLVSELSAAMATVRLAGLSVAEARVWLGALAQATVRNVFEHGEAKSFSGPFARGDAETIRLHLQALAPHPMLAEIYRSLARHAAAALPTACRAEIQALLMRH